jgi:hypothetical protein
MVGAEKLATDLILKRGARLKMRSPFFLRWIGIPYLYLTITSPYEGTLMRVARYYLGTGISLENITDSTAEEALSIMSVHGKAIEKAVATAWLNGYWAGMIFTRPLAWYIRWHCTAQEVMTVAGLILLYGGVKDFMTTTRSVHYLKVTEPNLGQKTKGS